MAITFDNRKRAIFYRISSFLITILVIITITIIFFSDLVPKDDAIINRRSAVITIISLYVFFGMYRYWLDLHYFFFTDRTDKLIFRYYSLRPFSQLKRSIEIPKTGFYDYRIKNDVTKRKPSLLLRQMTLEGIKTFPPIRISGLSKIEIKKLDQILKRYSTSGK